LQLTRNGENMPLRGAGLTTEDGITWTLINTKKLTNRRGDYNLSLTASDAGIFDAAGNPLTANASDRWTNLVSVNADDPGITRRGTNNNDILQGTENADTLRGLKGNDILTGFESGDLLIGGAGNDTLISGDGQDTMNGGGGADRFVFSGSSQARALAGSLVDMPDLIKGFKAAKGDRFQLDFDNNARTNDRPTGLFNAGKVRGNTLDDAVKAAYGDRDQKASGRQSLGANQAVLLNWQGQTYLSVNDNSAGFSGDRDLVVGISGFTFRPGDTTAGVLAVSNYFA
jgi:Ca2+-binding RTX toxin-like protein